MHNFLRAIHHVLILSSCPVHFTFLLLFLTAHFKCWPSWAVSMFLTLAVCVMNSRLPLNLSRLVNRGTWIGGVVYNSQITMPKASILHYYFLSYMYIKITKSLLCPTFRHFTLNSFEAKIHR